MALVDIARRLARRADRLRFAPPVTHVYNPLRYAWSPHRAYLERFGQGTREVLLLGMNPGPHGMVQTGVPFGEVGAVRDWLGIEKPVRRPDAEHPRRTVLGFACRRSEVSGQRFWGWARARFRSAERFFARFFVYNYCPLAFLEETGRNRTPDRLPAAEREPLFAICDRALAETVDALRPSIVIGVGNFAAARAERALAGRALRHGRLLHPSPASPRANRGWTKVADRTFRELGIEIPAPRTGGARSGG